MRRRYFLFTILIGALMCFSLSLPLVSAEDSSNSGDTKDVEDKISKYEKKVADLQGKEKTLSGEIDYMDSQINLTELRIRNSTNKIAKTVNDIAKLSGDIEDLRGRVKKLQDSIEYQKKILVARLRERYKLGEDSPIIVLFGSSTVNQLIQRTEYLIFLEVQDRKLLTEMDKTRNAFTKQKEIFENKRDESEQLKQQLEKEKANLDAYKANLVDQQEEKKRLLDVTQNDEAKYQKLLADAKRERDQIIGAVGVLKNQTARRVKQGDLIGIQGNSGYSMGDHLHFGVYKYSSFNQIDGWNWYYSNYIDPSKMLKSMNVSWNTGCETAGSRTVGKGSWSWPLSSPTISQGFGHTCWSNIYYAGKDHPAYDMYGSYGASVYAVADGNAYFCRNCLGDGGNGVFIFHDNGYMTLYWHLR